MDLSPIVNSLAALGPWGIVAGVVLTLFVQFLRNRLGPQPVPSLPTPTPNPATNPLRLDTQFPLLHRLAQVLGIGSRGQPTTTADVPHGLLMQLRAEVERLSESKAADHAAALADLAPDIVTGPAK